MNPRILIVCVLLIAAGAYVHFVKPQPVFLEKPLRQFPLVVGDWTMSRSDTFSQEILDVLRPTDYMSRNYVDSNGQVVSLYMGYHGGRQGDGGIHSPRNCLPGAGWYLDSTEAISVQAGEKGTIDIVNTVMSKGPTTLSFYYWFQVRGNVLNDEYSLKLAEVWNTLSAQRKDAAFIRISMPVESRDNGRTDAMDRFVNDFYPVIHEYLPH
ncbi:MAG: EpsI family protein [Desulfovibrio sp.]|nr:EpsI family protein [Desulfovibrio sp.]|tara:strand:- start:8117 stop:8746 length:630 start_codon:yes stop_codon:yes gene_type:complete